MIIAGAKKIALRLKVSFCLVRMGGFRQKNDFAKTKPPYTVWWKFKREKFKSQRDSYTLIYY